MFFLSNTLKFLFSHPLSSSKPWKALINFVHWQLHSRLANQSLSAFVFRFVENTNIIIRGGKQALQAIFTLVFMSLWICV